MFNRLSIFAFFIPSLSISPPSHPFRYYTSRRQTIYARIQYLSWHTYSTGGDILVRKVSCVQCMAWRPSIIIIMSTMVDDGGGMVLSGSAAEET